MTFTAPILLSEARIIDEVENPSMAIDGQTVLIAWQTEAEKGDIFVRRSTDGGATFQPVVNLIHPSNLTPQLTL